MNKLNSVLAVALAFTVSACNYSNEFTGTFNGSSAKLTALSKNINKYCVALELTSNLGVKNNFISAQAVFNPNDLFAAKDFNTKGAECSVNQTEYLVGTRTATVLGTSEVSETQSVGAYNCQTVYYKNYTYQEKIAFQLKANADDQTVGTFEGTGLVDNFTDRSRVTRYGNVWMCRAPMPYPYPGPGYPRGPYPGPCRGGRCF